MSGYQTYPDLLGYVTQHARLQVGVLQIAITVKPFAVRVGQNFTILLLIQNTLDCSVSIAVRLILPTHDQKQKPSPFLVPTSQMAFDIKPAEFGYLRLPLHCDSKTSIGSNYRITLELTHRSIGEGEIVRGDFDATLVEQMSFDATLLQKLDQMRQHRYLTQKPIKPAGGAVLLDIPFNVVPGKSNTETIHRAKWVSLWQEEDRVDESRLIEKYQDRLDEHMLPRLNRTVMFKPLLLETKWRFAQAGLPLHDIEIILIAKLLTLVLEFGAAELNNQPELMAGRYNIAPYLEQSEGNFSLATLPKWFRAMLSIAHKDPHALTIPERIIPTELYLPLLMDAAELGYEIIEKSIGKLPMTREDCLTEVDHLLGRLRQPNETHLPIAWVYFPFVIAGMAILDRIVMSGEKIEGVLHNSRLILQARMSELDTQYDQRLFQLGQSLLEKTARRL